VEVVDDVDVVVDSSTDVDVVEVEVALLDVVDGTRVVDELDVEVVDEELVAPGRVLLVVARPVVVVVVVLLAGARVVDGRLVVVTVAGYGSGHTAGAGAFRAAKRPGPSFLTLPPNSVHQRRGPLVSTTATAPCAGSSSVIPSRSARMLMPLPSRRTTVLTSEPAPVEAGFVKR
jgi:hypothetical protein